MVIAIKTEKRRGIFKRAAALCAILLIILPLTAQRKMEESSLKILIISRFFDFVKWPVESDPGSNRFVVGLLGDTPLRRQKDKLKKRIRITGKTVEIIDVENLDQIRRCRTLIIGPSEADRLREILDSIGGRPILTISDSEGFGEQGVHINLYRFGKTLKFEINFPAVRKSGLIFSSKLYKLARIIQ